MGHCCGHRGGGCLGFVGLGCLKFDLWLVRFGYGGWVFVGCGRGGRFVVVMEWVVGFWWVVGFVWWICGSCWWCLSFKHGGYWYCSGCWYCGGSMAGDA